MIRFYFSHLRHTSVVHNVIQTYLQWANLINRGSSPPTVRDPNKKRDVIKRRLQYRGPTKQDTISKMLASMFASVAPAATYASLKTNVTPPVVVEASSGCWRVFWCRAGNARFIEEES